MFILQSIKVTDLTKIYETTPINKKARKEQGPGLWIKKLLRLRNQKMKRIVALNSVSFFVNFGEIFGIVGPNGAGKTSLIKILSGLTYPTSGNAKILGFDLIKDHERIKDKISYVSTSGWMGLEWQLTVYENLLFYGDLMRLSRKKSKAKIEELANALGMEKYMSKTIPQLSAGMREMLTLARGLLIDRPIIYLDEPTTSLDPFAREMFWKYVNSHLKDHSVIFSSHDPSEIEKYANRIMFISKGHVLKISKPAELLKNISNLKIYQAELSNAQNLSFDSKIDIIDKISLSDKRIKLRFVLNGSLNEVVKFLAQKGVLIHNITMVRPKISDIYKGIINEETIK